ncbi:hypothetical protein GCM10027605_00450 [Micromonospora zhanjiangensis]
MDPVRNPYAPGAGQRPPELAGRGRELDVFDIVLERVARSRPERSLMLTGLRGVGKTVLLNTLRSQAIGRLWGTGKIEARPDQSLRRPIAGALHMAVRELAPRHRAPDRIEEFLGVLKAFALRSGEGTTGRGRTAPRLRDRWQPGIDVPAAVGRADSGDIEIDLVELLTDAAGIATDVGTGIAVFIDEMQDVGPEDVSGLCAACHELSQLGAPLIVVGAGLPHLPAVLSAAKSYSERLFRYQRIDRLDRIAADQALCAPAAREQVEYEQKALDLLYEKSGGYPYFVQAYGKATWDHAPVPRSRRRTYGWPPRRPRRNWLWASSVPASSGPPRPSGSTCGRWRHCPWWMAGRRTRSTATTWTPRCPPPRSPARWAASRPACPPPGTR